MKRRLLIVSVLTLMLVGALSAESPAEARRCPFDMCVALYNECTASCNGNRQCVKVCQRDYNECLCANCNYSNCGEIPRAEPKAGTPGVAASRGTADGFARTFPADTFFRQWQAAP
jgi:hypothetical protein